MSVSTPVGPREVQDFQFKLLCRIRVFDQPDENYVGSYNLLAAASKYGLLFVGCREKLLAILLPHVLENEHSPEHISRGTSHGGIEITRYPRRELLLPHAVSNLGVNCDQSLLVVAVTKGGCSHALIYDIASFFSKNIRISKEIRLSTCPDAHILELSWNPGISNVLACCLSNGSVGIYEFKNGGVDINHLPPEAQATCFSWSPKGKQLVVGSKNGSLTQHKPDLKAVKSIPAPNVFEGPSSVLNILWISNYQFAAVYRDSSNESERPSLMIVNAPKGGGVTYVNFEDICYSSGNLRTPQFYLFHQANWNVIIVGSANSMEVGVLGLTGDQLTWEHWLLEDASRAELPLTSLKEETFPLGLCIDTSTQRQLPLGENQVLPPMPVLALLSHRGVLCLFYAINIVPGAAVVCTPPERVADESILQFFLTTPESEASGTDNGRSPPPVTFQPTHTASPLPVLTSPSNLLFPSTPQQTLSTPTQPVLSATSQENKLVDWGTPLTSAMDSNRLGRCINLNEKFDQTPQTQSSNSVKMTLATSVNDSLDPAADSASVPSVVGVNSMFGVGPLPTTGSFFGELGVQSALQINVTKVYEGPSRDGNLFATPATANNPLNFTLPAASSTPNLAQGQQSSLNENTPLLQTEKTMNFMGSTGNTGISNSELSLTTVSNQVKDRVLECGDSDVGKSKKVVNSDVLYLAIQQEMNLFEKEKSDLKSRLSKVNVKIGTPEEKEWLRSKGDILESFSRELQSTTSTHIAEVQALKSLLVESLAWVEDARSRAAQENDPCWLQIVRSEELDPVSSRTLGIIKQLAYYVESQLIQVDRSLDLQWANFQESCRDKIKGRLYIPSLEAVYQAMVLQSNILVKQKANVRRIVDRTAKHKPNKNNSLLGTSWSVLQTKSDTGLAVLAENLLQMRLGATCSSMEGSDISEIMAAGRYSMVASMATKLTPRKLETLREFLTQGSIRHTKPVKHTNSSLKSLAVDKISESYELILSNSVTPPSTNFDKGKIVSPQSKIAIIYEIDSKLFPNKTSGLGLLQEKSHLKGEKQDFSSSGKQTTPSDILGHIAKSVESKFKDSETFPKVSFSSHCVSGDNLKIRDTFSESISTTTKQSLPPSFSPQVNTSSPGAAASKSKGTANFTFGSPSQSSLGGQAKSSTTGSFNFQLSTPTSSPSFVYTLNKKSGFNFFSSGATSTTSNSVQYFGSTSEICEPAATTSVASFAFGSLSATSTASSASSSLTSKTLFGQPSSTNTTAVQSSETPLFSSSNTNTPFSFSTNSAVLTVQTTPAKSVCSGISAKNSTESKSFNMAAADSTSQPAITKSSTNLSMGSSNITTSTNGSQVAELTQNSSSFTSPPASKSAVGTVPVDFGFSQLSSALSITSLPSSDATVEAKARNVETTNAESLIALSGSAVASLPTISNTPRTFSFSGPNASLSSTSVFGGKTFNVNENENAPCTTTSVTFFGQPVCSPSIFPQSTGSLFGQKTSIFSGACNTSTSLTSPTISSSPPSATSLGAMSRTSEDKNVVTSMTLAKSSTISSTVTSSDLPIQANSSVSSQGSISSVSNVGTLVLSHPSSGGTTASVSAPSMSFGKSVTSASLFGACTSSIASSGISAPAITNVTDAAITAAPTVTTAASTTTAAAALTSSSSSAAATTTAAPTATNTTTVATTAIAAAATTLPTTTTTTTTGIAISSVLTTITTTTITTSPSVFGSGSLFGQAANSSLSMFKPQGTTTVAPVFGQGPTTSVGAGFGSNSTTSTSSLFGQTSAATPVFGLTATGNTSVFGPATATTTGSLFSGTVTSSGNLVFGHHSSTAKTVSVFGQPTTTTGASVFGQPTTSTATPAFGQTSSTSPTTLFGQPATTSTSVFGQTTTAASVFAQAVATTSVAPAFGSGSSASSMFGQSSATTSNSVFGQPATTSTSVFGGSSNAFGHPTGSFMGGSPPSFGGNATYGQSGGSLFGQSGTGFGSTGGPLFGGGGSTTNSSSTFGTAGNLFQSPSPGSIFGGSSTSASGAFSAPQGQSIAESGFGSPSAFGQKSGNFGSPPAFGQSPGGCGFGGSPTFGGAPTFGGSPIFGSPNRVFGSTSSSSGSGVFGGNGGQQQGSSTFENLANQNTMTFGNLASVQSNAFGSSGGSLFGGTATPQPQQSSSFQSTSSFGGSSFSSWR